MTRSAIDPVTLLPPLPKTTYTREEAYAELDQLYAQLPAVNCIGRCHDSCYDVDAPELERQRVEEAGGALVPPATRARLLHAMAAVAQGKLPQRCPSLGPLNNCTVYEARPLICRAFGTSRDLRCAHGCLPDKFVPAGEIHLVLAVIEQLSRLVTGVRRWPIEFSDQAATETGSDL